MLDIAAPAPIVSAARAPLLPAWRWNLHPGFGLGCVIAGSILAWALMPQDIHPAGSLQLPAIALALGLLAPFFRAAFSAPASMFHPIHVLAAAPVYWLLLDPIQSAYPLDEVDFRDVSLAFFAISLFAIFVWLSCIGKVWRLPRIVTETAGVDLSIRALYFIGLISFVLCFLRFAIPAHFNLYVMLAAFTGSRWAVPWSRGLIGGWDSFLDHISYFGYVLPPLVGIMARRLGLLNWRTIILFVLAFILTALFATGGGRRIIGVMVGSGVVAWFLSARRVRVRDFVVLGAVGVLLLAFLQVMVAYRNVGITEAFDGNEVEQDSPTYMHVDDNFLRLAQVVQIIPESHPHVGMSWVIWVAIRPIPRAFWPGKPTDMGFDLPAFLGAQGVSYSMSLIGELYVAFGFIGIAVGGLLLGSLARSVAQVLSDGPKPGIVVFFSCALFAFFAGMRSGIELVLMSYGVLAWIGLTWVYRRFYAPSKAA